MFTFSYICDININTNKTLQDYVRNYNITFHTGIDTTPMTRFQDTYQNVCRPLSLEWLDKCFYNRIIRTIRHNATVSINNTSYDVPMQSIKMKVEISFLPNNMYHMEYISLSTVSVSEFYKEFWQLLGVSYCGSKTGMFRSIKNQIYYLYKEKRQPLLLAIDETKYLNTGILNDIKMLMNYGYDSLNRFILILCESCNR